MGQSAIIPEQVVNLAAESVVGNPNSSTGQGSSVTFAQLGLLWIAGLPTSDPHVVGSPFITTISGQQVICISGSPGLSGPLTWDTEEVTWDSVAITWDKVEY